MLRRIQTSLKRVDHRLYIALLILGLCPTIYTTVRVFLLGQLPGDWSFSIAGQLSWISLLYEILNEAILLPLFYFVGKVAQDRAVFTHRVRTGLLVSLGLYLILSGAICLFVKPLLSLMATDPTILPASAVYIRIESVANVFAILSEFALVALVTVNKSRYLYLLTLARLALSVTFDVFLVSSLPVSLNLGVNGVGVSNILTNLLLLAASLAFLKREGIDCFAKGKLSFGWMKAFLRVGGVSGLESLVRNVAYMVMISRMVNVVGEQGTYWVANNFIWGWLLLPVLQLGELIKRETAESEDNVRQNTLGYLILTGGIVLLWVVSIPVWRPFMTYMLQASDVDKLMQLVLILLGFYALYAFQNVFDATFYGLGKTNYMLFESVVTNAVYYGGAFALYLAGVWTPTLNGIAWLFGIGMAFDSVVSLAAYVYLLKKKKIRLLR